MLRRINRGIHALRIALCNAKADAAQSLLERRQSFRELLPGIAAIRGLE